MRTKTKGTKITAIFLALTMLMSISTGIMANEPEQDYVAQEDFKFEVLRTTITDISIDEVPEGITPIEVNSVEEFLATQNDITVNYQEADVSNNVANLSRYLMFGNQLVYTISFAGVSHLKLYCDYSYDQVLQQLPPGFIGPAGFVKRFTSASAYTTHTGYTVGQAWEQSFANATIASNKSSVYCRASGVIKSYLLIEGGLQLAAVEYNLSGYVYE